VVVELVEVVIVVVDVDVDVAIDVDVVVVVAVSGRRRVAVRGAKCGPVYRTVYVGRRIERSWTDVDGARAPGRVTVVVVHRVADHDADPKGQQAGSHRGTGAHGGGGWRCRRWRGRVDDGRVVLRYVDDVRLGRLNDDDGLALIAFRLDLLLGRGLEIA